MIVGGCSVPVGLFMYGWNAANQSLYNIPIVATGVCCFGLEATTIPASTYMVDASGIHGASAIAATDALKFGGGAILPIAGPPLYEHLGLGWGNSLLEFIVLPLLVMRFE